MKHTKETLKQILIEAKELISVPEKYCKNFFAIDSTTQPISVRDEKAVCFCSRGAVKKILNDKYDDNAHIFYGKYDVNSKTYISYTENYSIPEQILNKFALKWLNENIENYALGERNAMAHVNNNYGHSAAMEVFDMAIESLN